jgi:hypothetical protein
VRRRGRVASIEVSSYSQWIACASICGGALRVWITMERVLRPVPD